MHVSRKNPLVWLVLAAFCLSLLPATAQAQDPQTPDLVPFTDAQYGLEGVRPVGWTAAGNGLYARRSSTADPTLLAIQAAPLDIDALWLALLPQFALSEIPAVVETVQTGALEWTLYRFDYRDDIVTVAIDLALAHADGTSYIVVLQTTPADYDGLHNAVFLPVVGALLPLDLDRDLPYRVEDVTFASGDETLSGTLTLPDGDGPHPAVVLMSGSGPNDRDETVGGFRIFRVLADALTQAGVAVLRYDDRGVGQSTGDYDATSIYDFAADGQAAVDFLRTRADINPDQVGILGHSEGGVYSAIIGASPDSNVAFIVIMAGPTVSGAAVLRQQNIDILELGGATDEQIAAQIDLLESLFPLIAARDWDGYEETIYDVTLAQLQALSDEDRAALGITDLEAAARQEAATSRRGYANESFASLMDYDPAADLRAITAPVLAIFGELDVQVSPEQNSGPIEAAFADSGNPDATVVTIAGANHLFQVAETGAIEEYTTLEPAFAPEFVTTLIDWLLARVDVAG